MAGGRLAHLPAFLEVFESILLLIFVIFITIRVWSTPSPSMDKSASTSTDRFDQRDWLTHRFNHYNDFSNLENLISVQSFKPMLISLMVLIMLTVWILTLIFSGTALPHTWPYSLPKAGWWSKKHCQLYQLFHLPAWNTLGIPNHWWGIWFD